MRNFITAALIGLFGVAGAQASSNMPSALACDEALQGIDRVKNNYTDSGAEGALGACLEVANANCSTCGGFFCPPASTTAAEHCRDWLDPSTSPGAFVKPTVFNSEKLKSGVHFVSFEFPVDEFDTPDKVTIAFVVKNDAEPATLAAITNEGDKLYITSDYMEDGKYTCKPTGFPVIDTGVKPSEIWDARRRNNIAYGAKRSDWTILKDIARCQAWGIQAFTVTISQMKPIDPTFVPPE